MGSSPYGNLGGMDLGGAVQNVSGIPSDFTSAAQAMGFMPNPYASPAQQMMDAQRFLSLMKNINDTTMGTNNAWNKLAPGNPVQAMPLYMRNMYNAYGALANSPAGMNLLPNGSQGMFQNGGYQMGGLGNNMSRMLQTYLGQLNPSQQPGPADTSRAEQGTNPGPGGLTVGANTPGGGGQTNPGGQPAGQNVNQGTPGPTIPVLSGVNDMARNIPAAGALLSSFENNTGDLLGRGPNTGGPSVPVLSGLNDMARAVAPGLGGFEDIIGGLAGGGGQQGGQQSGPGPGSNVTVNTSGSAMPRTMAILAQRFGINSVPQGQDPNAFVDNIVARILGGG